MNIETASLIVALIFMFAIVGCFIYFLRDLNKPKNYDFKNKSNDKSLTKSKVMSIVKGLMSHGICLEGHRLIYNSDSEWHEKNGGYSIQSEYNLYTSFETKEKKKAIILSINKHLIDHSNSKTEYYKIYDDNLHDKINKAFEDKLAEKRIIRSKDLFKVK